MQYWENAIRQYRLSRALAPPARVFGILIHAMKCITAGTRVTCPTGKEADART
jgi:hypothetical protein